MSPCPSRAATYRCAGSRRRAVIARRPAFVSAIEKRFTRPWRIENGRFAIRRTPVFGSRAVRVTDPVQRPTTRRGAGEAHPGPPAAVDGRAARDHRDARERPQPAARRRRGIVVRGGARDGGHERHRVEVRVVVAARTAGTDRSVTAIVRVSGGIAPLSARGSRFVAPARSAAVTGPICRLPSAVAAGIAEAGLDDRAVRARPVAAEQRRERRGALAEVDLGRGLAHVDHLGGRVALARAGGEERVARAQRLPHPLRRERELAGHRAVADERERPAAGPLRRRGTRRVVVGGRARLRARVGEHVAGDRRRRRRLQLERAHVAPQHAVAGAVGDPHVAERVLVQLGVRQRAGAAGVDDRRAGQRPRVVRARRSAGPPRGSCPRPPPGSPSRSPRACRRRARSRARSPTRSSRRR